MAAALRRYTSVNAVLDTLLHSRITLLSPNSWADQNDREMMSLYGDSVPGHNVFAFCMAEGNETAHHWQVFADGGYGACIKFDQDRLLSAIRNNQNVRHSHVSYVQWHDLSSGHNPSGFPFIKRSVFRFEKEYRLVATVPASDSSPEAYNVPIPISCITSIYLSGAIPAPHFQTLYTIIRSFPGCGKLTLRQSGLLQNKKWSASVLAKSSSERMQLKVHHTQPQGEGD